MTSALLLSEAPVTGRRQIDAGPLPLELGGALPDVEIAYETWGTPRVGTGGDIVNAILVLHALTGDAHVSGPSGPDQPTQGWWQGLIGPGAAIDPGDWFVVASNVLGGCRGTTGPSSLAPDGRAWGSRFPRLTIRDQVAAEARLADLLGIARFAAVIGGSMGGMRALEWVLCHPDRVGAVLALAVGGYATADQIGTQSTQIAAIHADPHWRGGDYYPTSGSVGQETNGPGAQLFGGPVIGLGIARRIAHLTYRSESELEHRFGRRPQQQEDPFAAGRFAIESYLEHHARKLADRFDAGSYVSLTQAMNTHDVGRDRGGVGTALARVTAPVVVAGIDTDRLYPLRLQQELADLIPTCGGLEVLTSAFGHDGFLIEVDAVANVVTKTLSLTAG